MSAYRSAGYVEPVILSAKEMKQKALRSMDSFEQTSTWRDIQKLMEEAASLGKMEVSITTESLNGNECKAEATAKKLGYSTILMSSYLKINWSYSDE